MIKKYLIFILFVIIISSFSKAGAESKPQSQAGEYKSATPFKAGATGVETKIVKKLVTKLPQPSSQKPKTISQDTLKVLSLPKPASMQPIYKIAGEQAKIKVDNYNYTKKTNEIIEKIKPKTNIQIQQENSQIEPVGDTVFEILKSNNVPLDSFGNKITPPTVQQIKPQASAAKPAIKPVVNFPTVADRITLSAITQKPSIKKLRKAVIVIDPGHGGKDPGATGKLGNREKNIVLAYGKALRDELNKTGKYIVKMTREDDRFVPLPDRVKIARRSGGDILISIHADSHPSKEIRGFSIYTISKNRAEREAGKLLAKSEYEEIIRGVPLKGQSKDVKEALIFISQNETKDTSDEFSKILAHNLGKKAKPLPKSTREGSLAVLTGADIPSVLLELGYMSNIYEERLLATAQQRQKMVSSIVVAINEYFKTYDYLLE